MSDGFALQKDLEFFFTPQHLGAIHHILCEKVVMVSHPYILNSFKLIRALLLFGIELNNGSCYL